MTNRRLRLLVCSTVFALLILGFASVAVAAPHLAWHTDNVYFDNHGRIVIDGYFYNNGTRTVTWVNRHDVQVYLRQAHTNWWLHAAATYSDLNLHLPPGESLHWTFRIYNVDYSYFDFWNVKWNVNYQYR